MRKVFFSFHYERDSWRVSQVRNSNKIGKNEFENPYYDRAGWEEVKEEGDDAIAEWIDSQIKGTSVTAVLIGAKTSTRKWVKYEIAETIRQGHGLIGVKINKIKDQNGDTDDDGVNPLSSDYKLYLWNNDNGRENLGTWIEDAAS
jgi:hypothetical protein